MFTEQQEKWLKRVEDLFMRYGIKSVTMDDVARELGISKKTLYLFVDNKDDLVNKMLERHISEEKSECSRHLVAAGNAIEEMFLVMEANSQQLQQMKANVVYDLQKYHRDAWEKIQGFQRGFLYDVVRANLERGVREGLYRNDFDVDIIAKLHIALSFQLFDEDMFPQLTYSKESLFREYLLHYLYGIVSEKGLQILKAKLS
ncbi:MAG: TetR/AcrR family transcriptional regulator [Lewinellaceae bacterium]|nr:TetR/AcrR family transcriptional regulator [Saprospiraceae bacterium]MCB9316874.1 TetR/AcrR family transcriptional regulator [Lewinellaceae bacterium]MCB9331590.1 TetR/AcrR family transcriptional regulator [Lewinellaceae bacterium]